MRNLRLLDWSFITDGTRWQRKPSTHDSAEDYIEAVARSYRRDLWRTQDCRIEVWLEKDALADVIADVTGHWDVSLMVSRGQSSATFLHAAAKNAEYAFDELDVKTFIYAMYDYDAGGDRAAKAVREDLAKYAPGVPIHFERLAVTPQQITTWNLPTRPAKKSDPQAAQWGSKPAVELDAIMPNQLTQLVENAILRHVDRRLWEHEQAIEHEERQGLLKLRDVFGGKAA